MSFSLNHSIKLHSMDQQLKSSAVSKHRRLLTQLLAFIALAIVLSLSPRIEAWLRQREVTVQPQSTGASDSVDDRSSDESRQRAEDFEQSHTAPDFNPNNDSSIVMNSGEEPSLPTIVSEASSDEQDQNTKTRNQPKSDPNSDARPEDKNSTSGSTKSNSSKKKSDGKGSVIPMKRDPAPKRTAEEPSAEATEKNSSTSSSWGKLREIRENVFESTAGLVYRSGSADGHRLRHVMKHAVDDPSKPVHGVFNGDGSRDVVLALIDEAFDKAKKGGKDVRTEEEGERTVFTVNMKKSVGFTGGQEGQRRDHPECRFIRIVVERQREVITAFPTNR